MSDLLSAYRHWRRRPYTAAAALAYARRDLEAGKRRYASSPWHKHCGNPAMSPDRAMWVERPSDMGLRFVGYADELAKLDHTGWYTNDFQDKIRGVVYQLPGRDGKARFVAGHDDADNGAADSGGPAYVDFSQFIESDFEAEMRTMGKSYWTPGYWVEAAHESARKEAALAADEFTRVRAEREREYQTAWRAGAAWADAGEEIAATRADVREVLAQFRAARAALATREDRFSRLCALIRSDVANMLESIQGLRDKRAALASGDHEPFYFHPSPELRAAFNDGAGAAVI